MVRRLFVLLLLSMIVIVDSAFVRPARAASQEQTMQDHIAWGNHTLQKMETIKPGMMRFDLLRVSGPKAGCPQGCDEHLSVRTVPISKLTSSSKRLLGQAARTTG